MKTQSSLIEEARFSTIDTAQRSSATHITLKRALIVRTASIIAILLVIANIITQYASYATGHKGIYGLVPLFDLEGENNLPSYFSALLLLFAAVLVHVVALSERRSRTPFAAKWTILAWTFLYLSIDEAASLHELLIRPTKELFGRELTSGVFFAGWVIPGLLVTVLFAWWFLRFFLQLPRKIQFLFFLAGVLYIGGVLGMEMLSIRYFERYLFDFTYSMLVTVEESLEMAGVIVFIHALMLHIETHYPELRFAFSR